MAAYTRCTQRVLLKLMFIAKISTAAAPKIVLQFKCSNPIERTSKKDLTNGFIKVILEIFSL